MMNVDEQAYLDDPYRTEFSSRVREVEAVGEGRSAVFLERTYFYPDSGGQPDDHGTLGGFRIIAVSEEERGVRHLIEGTLAEGAEVEGRIDWERRFDHMQQHSGQHLLSRIFLDEKNLRTVSFHLGGETCTIDLEGMTPSQETLESVELRANETVFANVPIRHRILSAEEFRGIEHGDVESLRNGATESAPAAMLRSRLPDGIERVRIVEIAGRDRSTCCGTHVRSTGEIGIVKILGMERVKGLARVEFLCGRRAVRDYAAKHRLLSRLAGAFTTDWREVERVAAKLGEEARELRKKSEELTRELAGYRAADLAAPTGSAGPFHIVKRIIAGGDAASLRETVSRIREKERTIALFGLEGPTASIVFGCSPGIPIDMGDIMRMSAALIGARGGGGKDFAQGGGGDGSRVAEALDEAERRIREALGSEER
jgi:alanyl-tRNA synthetase